MGWPPNFTCTFQARQTPLHTAPHKLTLHVPFTQRCVDRLQMQEGSSHDASDLQYACRRVHVQQSSLSGSSQHAVGQMLGSLPLLVPPNGSLFTLHMPFVHAGASGGQAQLRSHAPLAGQRACIPLQFVSKGVALLFKESPHVSQ